MKITSKYHCQATKVFVEFIFGLLQSDINVVEYLHVDHGELVKHHMSDVLEFFLQLCERGMVGRYLKVNLWSYRLLIIRKSQWCHESYRISLY